MKSQNNQFFKTPHSWQRPPDDARCFTVGTIFTFRHHVKNSFYTCAIIKMYFYFSTRFARSYPKSPPKFISKQEARERERSSFIAYSLKKFTDGRPFPRPPNYIATYLIYEPVQCGMCDQQSLRSACAYAQSDQSLCYRLSIL